MSGSVKLEGSGKTHVGKVRKGNDDALLRFDRRRRPLGELGRLARHRPERRLARVTSAVALTSAEEDGKDSHGEAETCCVVCK